MLSAHACHAWPSQRKRRAGDCAGTHKLERELVSRGHHIAAALHSPLLREGARQMPPLPPLLLLPVRCQTICSRLTSCLMMRSTVRSPTEKRTRGRMVGG